MWLVRCRTAAAAAKQAEQSRLRAQLPISAESLYARESRVIVSDADGCVHAGKVHDSSHSFRQPLSKLSYYYMYASVYGILCCAACACKICCHVDPGNVSKRCR